MQDQKTILRGQAYQRRDAQINRLALSDHICTQIQALPAYQQASIVMCYVHCRSEVQTASLIKQIQLDRKQCIVPYCTKDAEGNKVLGLWLLRDISELVAGTWGILEPPVSRWQEPGRSVAIQALDLILVPGVAFSRDGARLGNGAGYYDRLLANVRGDTKLYGLAYETQIFTDLKMQAHDVYMHCVVTEKSIYHCCRL